MIPQQIHIITTCWNLYICKYIKIKIRIWYILSGQRQYEATYLIFYQNQEIYMQDDADKDVRKHP